MVPSLTTLSTKKLLLPHTRVEGEERRRDGRWLLKRKGKKQMRNFRHGNEHFLLHFFYCLISLSFSPRNCVRNRLIANRVSAFNSLLVHNLTCLEEDNHGWTHRMTEPTIIWLVKVIAF